MDLISFDSRLITENNFHDDNRPYRYEPNNQEQNLFINNDNYNKNEEYRFVNQNENRNEDFVLHMNENTASEYTTSETTTSAQNARQTETSTTSQFVRIETRVVSPRQNTHDPQSYLDTSSHRNITFNLPTHPDEVVQDETQNITSTHDTSVNILSPTRIISNNTRNTTRSIYDPPSIPSAFQQSNKTIQSENIRNANQQTFSQHYGPFNYSFFPPSNTNIQTNNTQNISQPNNNLRTQHPYEHLLQTNSSQSNFSLQN